MSWAVGDVLRHPDGRTGQVVGLGNDKVLVRLGGGLIEWWPADELKGTGVWLALEVEEYR